MRKLALMIVALLCAGCASLLPQPMRIDVTTYSRAFIASKPVAVFEDSKQSLEQSAVNGYLKESMAAAGIKVVNNPDMADIVAIVSYMNDNGSTVITGSSSSIDQRFGDISTSVNTATVYNRTVWVRFIDKTTLKANTDPVILYDTKAVSRGSNGHVPVYVPAMLKAIFAKYPSGNGETRTEVVFLY